MPIENRKIFHVMSDFRKKKRSWLASIKTINFSNIYMTPELFLLDFEF